MEISLFAYTLHLPISRLHKATISKLQIFSTDSGSPAVFSCILAQCGLHSILTRCPIPAGQKWPTAWCYTSILHCRYGVLRCRQHEICTFEFCSKALPWSHLTTQSVLGLHYAFPPTWFFQSNGFFCITTPCRPELLIWLTLYFILSYWSQSDCWPLASLVLQSFEEQAFYSVSWWFDIACTSR